MTRGLVKITQSELFTELEREIRPILQKLVMMKIENQQDGHCFRCDDLDIEVAIKLCENLRDEVPGASMVILDDGSLPEIPRDFAVSGTKLVELRNPRADGALRPPLLVFIPNGVQASAEDSFGESTFEKINVGDVYGKIRERLLQDFPQEIRTSVSEILTTIEGWKYADLPSQVRWLLTIQKNGYDLEVVGASLFTIGLIPDFELLKNLLNVKGRLSINIEVVSRLTEPLSAKSVILRVLDLELVDAQFEKELAEFLNKIGLIDPYEWCARIANDQSAWKFSFHNWRFKDKGECQGKAFIHDVLIDLPSNHSGGHTDGDEASQQTLYIGKGNSPRFAVTFRVQPAPANISGLNKFAAEVISVEDGPIGLIRKKSKWVNNTKPQKIPFDRLKNIDWKAGWHYIRVLAYNENNKPIPLVDEKNMKIDWETNQSYQSNRSPNESDLFMVVTDSDEEEDPKQRSYQQYPSLTHIQLEMMSRGASKDVTPGDVIDPKIDWSDKKIRRSGDPALIAVKYRGYQKVHIPVNPHLKGFELEILEAPVDTVSWRLRINSEGISKIEAEDMQLPVYPSTPLLKEARARYKEMVLCDERKLVSQAFDFSQNHEIVNEYASSYRAVLIEILQAIQSEREMSSTRYHDLENLLRMDTIGISICDRGGEEHHLVLVSPIHPLRAVWFAVWSSLGHQWMNEAASDYKAWIQQTLDTLKGSFSPLHAPVVVPSADSGAMIFIDNLTMFWAVYGAPDEPDPRGLFASLCAHLEMPEPAYSGTLIDGAYLASRIKRYILQHPYISTLTVNVFNPGKGGLLAGALCELQKEKELSDLRYDIRMYALDPAAAEVGESLFDLQSPPPGSTLSDVADDFSAPMETHLRTKLALAVKGVEEFSTQLDRRTAHLTIAFDLFPPGKLEAIASSPSPHIAPLYGLLQEFNTTFHDETGVFWERIPKHGSSLLSIPGAEETQYNLTSLGQVISNATAVVVTGNYDPRLLPLVTLSLDDKRRALIHEIHESSDWVITLDRHMGIEFYDHPPQDNKPDYLIDFNPDVTSSLGHRLFVTSRSIDELRIMASPVLRDYGLSTDDDTMTVLIDQLRALSGRLALKLIASPNQQAEAFGLALARLFLIRQGAFTNQIVVPLDAHIDLFTSSRNTANTIDSFVSLKRTDLAVFDLDPKHKTITCRLVEVKNYNSVGNLSAYASLRRHAIDQISQSEKVIKENFGIESQDKKRPDHAIKVKELAVLLEFYLSRAERYDLISKDASDEARLMLEILEGGYSLNFSKSAIIFDFQWSGQSEPEVEDGVEFHRIGRKLIDELLCAAVEERRPPTVIVNKEESSDFLEPVKVEPFSTSVITSAAFLSPRTDRTVDWDSIVHRAEESFPGLPEKLEELGIEKPTPDPEVVLTNEGMKGTDSDQPIDEVTKENKVGIDRQVEVFPEPLPTDEYNQVETPCKSTDISSASYNVLLGVTKDTSLQYGIFGESMGRTIALDLNQTHTISLFGVQGGGKSYTLGSIVEMAVASIPHINQLPRPLTTVIFHYSQTMDYTPEFLSMIRPNQDDGQINKLKERYSALPQGLSDVVLLVPRAKVEEREREFPGITVHPLTFSASELQPSDWKFLMGAVGNQSLYIKQLMLILKRLRNDLTLDKLRSEIENSVMPDHIKTTARSRLDLVVDFIDDEVSLRSVFQPGRLVIVDLRDEFIEKDEALGLFAVILNLCAGARSNAGPFNKLVVFDEAHKYIENPDLIAGLVEMVREMRHKGTSILVASQDPPSVPIQLIELSTQIIMHKFNSPSWLKHIQKANASLQTLTAEKMAQLATGEAYVWSREASDPLFMHEAVKVRCRPRVTEHGGATKTAI
ncbi:methylation-associated defense system ATP-binding protein MAD8 [Methanosphaerula subterraneus]|uniref:methylation-associated defense system ATP-binding protein MAD8 n=1 Tax=Methanosphaerula subterraneus TaxID=3350244 RepID=UPI003F853049